MYIIRNDRLLLEYKKHVRDGFYPKTLCSIWNSGQDGHDGRDGERGATGPAGKDGLNGKDGRDGQEGPAVSTYMLQLSIMN